MAYLNHRAVGCCPKPTGDAGSLGSFAVTIGGIALIVMFLPSILGVKKKKG